MRIQTFAFVILTMLSLWPSHASASLIINGGFETGDFTGWNYTSLDDFSFVGTGFAHSGDFAAFFGDTQESGGGSISQSLTTEVGASYLLSFWFSGDGDDPSGFTTLVDGKLLFDLVNPPFDDDYVQYTFIFTATGASTHLEFDAYDDPFFINLDDVSVNLISASVPEPSTLGSTGIAGLLALVVRFRHRRADRGQ